MTDVRGGYRKLTFRKNGDQSTVAEFNSSAVVGDVSQTPTFEWDDDRNPNGNQNFGLYTVGAAYGIKSDRGGAIDTALTLLYTDYTIADDPEPLDLVIDERGGQKIIFNIKPGVDAITTDPGYQKKKYRMVRIEAFGDADCVAVSETFDASC